jgi:hypothetical protein
VLAAAGATGRDVAGLKRGMFTTDAVGNSCEAGAWRASWGEPTPMNAARQASDNKTALAGQRP